MFEADDARAKKALVRGLLKRILLAPKVPDDSVEGGASDEDLPPGASIWRLHWFKLAQIFRRSRRLGPPRIAAVGQIHPLRLRFDRVRVDIRRTLDRMLSSVNFNNLPRRLLSASENAERGRRLHDRWCSP